MNTETASPRIGLICPRWLPTFGGAQQYVHHLAQTLVGRGFDVRVFAGTAAHDTLDNGEVPATRHAPRGDLQRMAWTQAKPGETSAALAEIVKHYRFMEAALAWAADNGVEVAIVGHPFQQAELHHVRELYVGLQSLGVRVGCLHFDLGRQVEEALGLVYAQGSTTWEDAAQAVCGNLLGVLKGHEPLQAYFMMGSPLFFAPDFVISCSDWSSRFIDPADTTPKFTLHPMLDAAYWSAPSPEPPLERFDVLMVNPQGRKGPGPMERLIAGSAPTWTFRILEGGWGNSLAQFVPKVRELPAAVEGRVEVRSYVKDMRQAYGAAGVVFFPSLYEGYGLTAVEPMYAGAPVVSSNYPAILEAVGDGALTCCPQQSTAQAWHDAVDEVLNNPALWRAKSLERAAQLQARQAREIEALDAFLRTQAQR